MRLDDPERAGVLLDAAHDRPEPPTESLARATSAIPWGLVSKAALLSDAPKSADGETFMVDGRLVRMVLRVSPDLQEDLISVSERLFEETRLDYSYAAVARGLIALGLASIAGKANLAVEFAGARVPRGRKRGERWKRSTGLDQ